MTKKSMRPCVWWVIVIPVFLQACIDAAITSNPTTVLPNNWYSGDMHVHRNCGEGTPFIAEDKLKEMMDVNDLNVVVLLADMGNGEVQDPQTDLVKVTGSDAAQSTSERILHWDAEWHWDATYSKFEHQALGGHLVLLGLANAKQVWQESPYKILEWAKEQNAVMGFTHLQYLEDTIQSKLDCCIPIDLPVEAAFGTIDFVSEDVYSTRSRKGRYNSEAAMHAYYKLLNCGFRLGLAAGTDYPCNSEESLGSLLTFVQVDGDLTYAKWIAGIKKGKTVISRAGNHEFLNLVVNERYQPGDDIATTKEETFAVNVTWSSDKNVKGVIEIVQNGIVVASVKGNAKPGKPVIFSTKVNVSESSWLIARRMEDGEHVTHTAPIYAIKNGAPIRGSKGDAAYYIRWIDNLLEKIEAGREWHTYFPKDYDSVKARYLQAREIYANILNEANK